MPRLPGLIGAIVLITSASIACGPAGPAAPGAVRPTLDGWRATGLACGDATKDNVPSGLLQWSCHGVIDGIEVSATVDGDDRGVFGLQAVVPAATPDDKALETFGRLIDATPLLEGGATGIRDFIAGWPPIETTGTFGQVTVRVDVDQTWRSLTIRTGL